MVARRTLQWQAYLEFADAGYVKDSEKIDAPALLGTLKENTEKAMRSVSAAGWYAAPVDWATPPVYNTTTSVWSGPPSSSRRRAVRQFLHQDPRQKSYTSVTMVTDPANLSDAEASWTTVLTGYTFNSGETYADCVVATRSPSMVLPR